MDTCYHCKYYYVTWDEKFPHGCRSMQFKSKEFPAAVVLKNSGIPCLLIASKVIKRRVVKQRKGNYLIDKEV